MLSNIATSLEVINELSRLILSQIDIQVEYSKGTDKLESKPALTDSTLLDIEKNPITNEQLLNLVSKRQFLITSLFETHTQDQFKTQLSLINEMVLLDEQLTSKSQKHKQALVERVLKLKKSKKVTSLYKKY
ncbi:MAG: hypothetical protein GY787_05935 [Alteromonadales bacterium]|nr:hypothetical protein [Alteromonadales bacterium]